MKIVEINEKEYKDFFDKSSYTHFMQCYEWGEACKGKGLKPLYLGLKDNDNLKGICLCFVKEMPFKLKYYYAPRGPVLDFNDKSLIKEFSIAIKSYLKENNGIYFKMDPGVVLHTLDEKAQPLKEGINNEWFHDYLLELRYSFKGYTKLFEANQPRFTFRIDTKKPIEEIEKSMNKTYLKTIKRSYNYDLEITNDYNNDTFYNLMKDIANRDNFNGYPKKFYEDYDKFMTQGGKSINITIKIYPDKLLKKAENELKDLETKVANKEIPEKKMADTNNIITRLKKDIEVFSEYKGNENGIVSLILICPIINNQMWTLYIGNNSLATYTFAVNRSYYEAMKIASEKNCEFLDLFGTCGDPGTKEKNYNGIHEYKRKMGGTYTEFVGEYDIVNKPFINKMLPIMLKIYRKLRRR